jgi:hypothetical protein
MSALLVLGLGGWIWVVHYRAKHAVADYKKQLVAAGEKLTIGELVPDPVSPEQNGAGIFLKATSLLNTSTTLLDTNPPYAMRMVAPGKAMVGSKEADIQDYSAPWSTNSWEEAEAALADLSEALDLLDRLIEKPVMDFQLDYHQGFSLQLPNLVHTKKAAQRLSAAALCDLHRGDTTSAVRIVRAMLALSKATAHEKLIISQLVRIAIAAITVNANWELLQSPAISDAQLAALQRVWTELEFVESIENALAMERAMGQLALERMRNSSKEFNNLASSYAWAGKPGASSPDGWYEEAELFVSTVWDRTKLKTKETAWRVSWSYHDELRTLKGSQVLLESARTVRTNGIFVDALRSQEKKLADLGIHSDKEEDMFNTSPGDLDVRSLLSQGILSLNRVLARALVMEAYRHMMITALALKRHQLRHGMYPEDLTALTPEFLTVVPRDPVDGQPLRYRREGENSFLLYSVGEDAKDDGGDPLSADPNARSLNWRVGRDWVWPQPATSDEVAAYIDAQAKRQPQHRRAYPTAKLTPEQQAFFERYGLAISNAPSVQTNDPATNVLR